MKGSTSKEKSSRKEMAGLAMLVFSGIGGTYLWSLKSAADKLVVLFTPRIHKISLTGILVRIEVKIKNPTSTTLTLNKPFISIEHGTSVIGSSLITAADSSYTIAQGTKTFEPIDIELRFMELLQTAPAIVSEYQRSGTLRFKAKVTTKVAGLIPVEQNMDISL